MGADFVRGMGEGALSYIDQIIPEPDIALWMGKKTSREQGNATAKKVAALAIPLGLNGVFMGLSSVKSAATLGAAGLLIGAGVALIGVGKAWAINKIIDKAIKDGSPLSHIKDEIKKVADATAAVLISVGYLALSILFPFLGPVGIFTAGTLLVLNIGTLVRASYQLHSKRKEPGTVELMRQSRAKQKEQAKAKLEKTQSTVKSKDGEKARDNRKYEKLVQPVQV